MHPLNVLVFVGMEGIYHDHVKHGTYLAETLHATGHVTPTFERDPTVLAGDTLSAYDAAVFYTDIGALTPDHERALLDFVASGRGFVGIHTASASFRDNQGYVAMLGSQIITHSPYMPFTVEVRDAGHPITEGLRDFQITDELYVMRYDPATFHLLLSARYEGQDHPMAYTKPYGNGRVFYLALGHTLEVFQDSNFQQLVYRGIQWATGRL
jgi:type 1 glutamine amidotransferase